MKYCPMLTLKPQIYLTAYNRLKNDTKKNIIPIFELFDTKYSSKISKIEQLALNILDKSEGNDLEILYKNLNLAYENNKAIIPVIDDSYNFENKKTTFNYFKKIAQKFQKIIIKINGIDPLIIPDNMESMLFFSEKMENIIFLLDIEKSYKYSKIEMLTLFKNAINYIKENISDEIKTFIITGSLIETSSKNHTAYEDNNDECFKIKNNLYRCYLDLKDFYSSYEILYSDYTIDEKHIFKDDDIEIRSFYPSIKYTIKTGDICVFKSNNLNTFSDYKNLCLYITNLNEFNPKHCYGCQEINKCSISGGGAPASWKTNMIIHHIERFNEIINKKD